MQGERCEVRGDEASPTLIASERLDKARRVYIYGVYICINTRRQGFLGTASYLSLCVRYTRIMLNVYATYERRPALWLDTMYYKVWRTE